MTNFIIRVIAFIFACALTSLLISFSYAVAEHSIIKSIAFLIVGVLSQLGVFLSTYQIKKLSVNLLIAAMMLPFFILMLNSTLFDSSFINRLMGNAIQMGVSIAYIVGVAVYTFSYYKIAIQQYNKLFKRDI